ncbi:MAG: D-glycero-alpha-D-manno-heptose-1,7-bisphosphate 7-phosphatase [Bryobacteraceae bacterium]
MPAESPNQQHRAAFLDRDGVINRKALEGAHITSPDEFELLPGALPGLALLALRGFRLIVVTNQRAVALRRLSLEGLAAIHAKMERLLAAAGLSLDAVYFCPHDRGQCDCRKPAPGLLLQAFRDFPALVPRDCVLVGDSPSDLEAARRAGVPAVQMPVNGSLEDAVRSWLSSRDSA